MKRRFASSFLLVAVLALADSSRAQLPTSDSATPIYTAGETPSIQVTTLAIYQIYDDSGSSVSQLTLPVSVFVPVTPRLGLSLRTSYAASDSDGMTSLSGLGDAQIAASYNFDIGPGSAVASASANLPSGESTLTLDEAATAFLIGQGFYGFRLPSLGQGFNVAPAVTWAVPLNTNLAVGLGAAYQVRGSVEPRTGFGESYDPGDELLLTAGLDARVRETSTVALDVTYARYGSDTWMGLDYSTGDAVAATVLWTEVLGPHNVRVLGRVGHRQESMVPPGTSAFLGLDATVPNQGRLLGHARFRVSPRLVMGAATQGRYYSASRAFEERRLFDAALIPEFEIMPGLTLLGRVGGTLGTLQGIEVGAGLSWSM